MLLRVARALRTEKWSKAASPETRTRGGASFDRAPTGAIVGGHGGRYAPREAVSLQNTVPPQIFLEEVSSCEDAVAIRGELDVALGATVAPGAGWQIRVRFEKAGGRLTGRGTVNDADGIPVATRALSTDGTQCASLARGLGVWATLVLDAEVDRTRAAPSRVDRTQDPVLGPLAARTTSVWPTAWPAVKRPPEADLFLRHAVEERTVELGVESFLMGGTGGGAVLGPSIYGVFEAAHGFFLRPALLVGHTIGGLSPTSAAAASFVGSRFDACARLPGMYLEHRGIQLDMCLGGDIGFSRLDSGVAAGATSAPTLPFLGFGPSFGLRGELGNNLSATIRGVTELSFLRDDVTLASSSTRVSPSPFVGRAEVGLSWSLR